MPRPAAAIASALLLVLVACGDDADTAGGAAPAPSRSPAVVVERWLDAVARGDAAAACRLTAPGPLRRRLACDGSARIPAELRVRRAPSARLTRLAPERPGETRLLVGVQGGPGPAQVFSLRTVGGVPRIVRAEFTALT